MVAFSMLQAQLSELRSAGMPADQPAAKWVAMQRSRGAALPGDENTSRIAFGFSGSGALLGVVVSAATAAKRRREKARVVRLMPPLHARGGEDQRLPEVKPTAGKGAWDEKFSWKKSWYPMAVVEDIDDTRPTRLQLLGEDLVVWRDTAGGDWHVFEDRCPHRCVPLSEGRIEKDGSLMCSYHGWRFDGEGKLQALPQALPGQLPKLQADPRSCAPVRPCQIRHGILWVWGETGPDAALESALTEPNVVEEIEDPAMKERVTTTIWSHRDLPYGWEVALENVTDPAHVDVAHHNIASNRYTDPSPIRQEWVRKPTSQDGFAFRCQRVPPETTGALYTISDFKPPSHLTVTMYYANGSYTKLVLHHSPTRPGWSRFVGTTIKVASETGEQPEASDFDGAPLPRWLLHLLAPVFIHQDLVFLHYQQSLLEKRRLKTGKTWRSTYWVPTNADTGTVALRQWLDKSGGIDWSPAAKLAEEAALVGSGGDGQLKKLFDTYTSHTSICKTCTEALERVTTAGLVMRYGAITLGAAGVAGASLPMAAAGACLGLGALALGKLESMFYEQPFNHQDND